MTTRRALRIAIIGAGPGGLCTAIKLMEAGFRDLVLLEKTDRIGGTWNHNRYPGCACDVQSELYSFSFDINTGWSRPYAPQPEILAYLDGVAERHGVLPLCRFGVEVKQAVWSDVKSEWTLSLSDGSSRVADVVVSGLGMFNDLAFPAIEGLETFAGACFHTAKYDWSIDLTGRRVAVIGSAASAIQMVPEIVKIAGQVDYYQRTANWVLPKEDEPYSEAVLRQRAADPSLVVARRNEIYQAIDTGTAFIDATRRAELEESGRQAISVVRDPALREKLLPTHPWGCKRPLFSNDYYPAFNRPNLELVTDPIERVTKSGVVAGGRLRPVDTLILATGFAANRFLSVLDVRGRDGISIRDAWKEGPQAFLGVSTAGFPNLFQLYGPNTNAGSIITMIEFQVDHVVSLVKRIAEEGLAWLDVRPAAMAEYNEAIQKAIAEVTVWQSSCNHYYASETGRIVTQYPHSMSTFKQALAAAPRDVFEVRPRA
ncbi:MAG: NAD(P)/FAD-dependent oxidoreductase [Deltaproteobacteria bacterium]|nr:NAD(P)/FAD-dependent oxidoreductase [Deltaproteobacteria bacterium]